MTERLPPARASRRTVVVAAIALVVALAVYAVFRFLGASDASDGLALPIGSERTEAVVAPSIESPAAGDATEPSASTAPVRELESAAHPPSESRARPLRELDPKRNARVAVQVLRKSDDSPVRGASIYTTVVENGVLANRFVSTDQDGRANVPVAREAAVQLAVNPSDEQLIPANVDLPPQDADCAEVHVIRLERVVLPRAWVRVIAREDGRAVPAARIVAWWRGPAPTVMDSDDGATTDADGLAEIELHQVPTQPVEVIAPGYGPALGTVRRGAHDRRDHPAVVVLDRAARVVGAMVDADGHPVAGVSIVATTDDATLRQGLPSMTASTSAVAQLVARADTEEDGAFVLEDLPSRVPVRVAAQLVRFDEGPTLDLTLQPGETRRVEWRLAEPTTLSGRIVLPDGTPSSDAVVRLRRIGPANVGPRAIAVEDDGTFEVGPFLPGEWLLGAIDRKRRLSASRRIVVEAAAAPPHVELALAADARLRGRVTYADGRPAGSVMVSFTPKEPSLEPRSGTTSMDGKYVLDDLVQCAGILRVGTEVRELSSLPDDSIDVVLPAVAMAELSVRTIAPGDPWAFTQIKLTCRRRDDASERVELPAGRFARNAYPPVLLLTPGTYDVIATHDDGRIGLASGLVLRANDERQVEIVLAPGAWITVHVRGPAEHADVRYDVRARMDDALVAGAIVTGDGFVDLLVPAGKVAFELWNPAPKRLTATVRNVSGGELVALDLVAGE